MSNYRFGKHPAKNDYRTLRFGNYLTPKVAAPPAAYDVLAVVYKKLKVSDPTVLFPMDGNDTLGDCTIAALAHAETVFHGLIGKKDIMAKSAAVKLYMHLTGGVDSGLNELDVLNYWQSTGADGDKLAAFVTMDPKNHAHVQTAIQLFGGVYLGFQVQQNAIQEFDARQPTWAWWDECVDEAYAVLPPEAMNATFAPGFNFAQLKADLANVAH
jgi:hypothetical protein